MEDGSTVGVAVAGAAAAVAGLFAVALSRRYLGGGRANRALLYWSVSLVMFALASLGLAVGEAVGWSEGWFRVYYLLGGILVVPWLALGTVQICARDPVTMRILGLAGLVTGVLFLPPSLATDDPALFTTGLVFGLLWGALLLTSRPDGAVAGTLALVVTFSVVATAAVLVAGLTGPLPAEGLPEGSSLFAPVIRSFAVAGNAVGAVLVIVGAATSALRLRGRGMPHLVVGNLLIALGVLVAASGGSLFAFAGDTGSHAIAFAVGVAIMYAGFTRTTRPVAPPGEPPLTDPVRDLEGSGRWR